MGIFDKSKTFKPNLIHSRGTTRFELHKHASETLGQKGLREAVKCPPGEDVNEWIAVNVVDFFNEVNIIYGHVIDTCTSTSCKTMAAGPKYEYLWADGVKVKKPIKCSAPEYVDYLMDWVINMFEDPTVFPPDEGTPFPPTFKSSVSRIFTRFFRVFGHIYYSHFSIIVKMGAEAHLNSTFKHFYYFCQEFKLIDARELAPLRALIVNLTKRDQERGLLDKSDDAFAAARKRSGSSSNSGSGHGSAASAAKVGGGISLNLVSKQQQQQQQPPPRKSSTSPPLCCKCKTPLSGHCPSIEGKEFHEHCFVCSRCGCSLAGLVEVLLVDEMPHCESCATRALPGGGGSSGGLLTSSGGAAGSGSSGGKPPLIASVHPSVTTVEGGSLVTLVVERASEPIMVSVGGVRVPHCDVTLAVDSGRAVVEFEAPAHADPGPKSIDVTVGSGQKTQLKNAIEYIRRGSAAPVPVSPLAAATPFNDSGPASDRALALCRPLTWYWGTMSSSEAERVLEAHENGSFFVRYSERSGAPVISWLDSHRRATHSPMRIRDGTNCLALDGSNLTFQSIDELLSEHTRTLQYPINRIAKSTSFQAQPSRSAPSPSSASASASASAAKQRFEEALSPRSAAAAAVSPAARKGSRADDVYATQSRLDVKALRNKFG